MTEIEERTQLRDKVTNSNSFNDFVKSKAKETNEEKEYKEFIKSKTEKLNY